MKNLDEVKKEAEVLVESEMKAVKGGINNDMAASEACANCCAASNGGIQQPSQPTQR